MDWFSREALSRQLSRAMDEGFCVDALTAEFAQSMQLPEIINIDQGPQFSVNVRGRRDRETRNTSQPRRKRSLDRQCL